MPLSMVEEGEPKTIVKVGGKEEVRKFLENLGFVDGTVDVNVDLFYETYRESALNSLRTVDIYVLEWGNGTLYY